MTDTSALDELRFLPQRFEPEFPIDELNDWPGNPRLHDDAAIHESIGALGFAGAIVVQEPSKRIIGGHGRRDEVLALGGTTIPALLIDCDFRQWADRPLIRRDDVEIDPERYRSKLVERQTVVRYR